jgi:hypothetical protein
MAFKFPVIHGINLAPGSTAQNFVFESLTADPLPAVAGRVWLNTTSKAFKYSTLDNTGAVLVKTFASAEALTADIADLQSQLNAASIQTASVTTDLQTQLNTEIARATGVEVANAATAQAYTDAQVAALVDGAPGVLNTLKELAAALENNPDVLSVIEGQVSANALAATAALNAEIARAEAAESDVAANLAIEVTNRVSAVTAESVSRVAGDAGLNTRLTTVEGQVNGKIGDLATLNTTSKVSIVEALNEVDANVSIERSRAIAAEGVLSTAVAFEANRADAAEVTLTANLAAEAATARAAELVLTQHLASEAVTARAAESSLAADLATAIAAQTGAVSAEATTARAAEATLTAAVSAEEASRIAAVSAEQAARIAADSAIRSDYNAKAFGYTSTAPAMQHTIAHGLNTAYYVVNILVKGTDGVYRNDVVPYEESDANNFVVYLAFAADIRVSVKSLVSL